MATVSIGIHTPMGPFTAGAHEIDTQGNTLGDVTGTLPNTYEGIGERIITFEGERRNVVNLFLANRDAHNLNPPQTPVPGGDVLSIAPYAAGGRP